MRQRRAVRQQTNVDSAKLLPTTIASKHCSPSGLLSPSSRKLSVATPSKMS